MWETQGFALRRLPNGACSNDMVALLHYFYYRPPTQYHKNLRQKNTQHFKKVSGI